MTRIGIFGGTFDPPHVGHLILAGEAWEQLKLDALLWMMTAEPPHKIPGQVSSLQQRLSLTQAALAGIPHFELSTLEIDRPGPHFAVDTVALVKQAQPLSQVYYVMGEDSLRDLPTWHEPQRLIDLCAGFAVMKRHGSEVSLLPLIARFPELHEKVVWLNTPLVDISSHDIRQRIMEKRTYRFFLPSSVYALIQKKLYYQDKK